MLTADILNVAWRSHEPVVVVSSDDDLWPSIQSALVLGVPTVQVHTRPGGIARNPYVRPGQAGYLAVELN